MTVQPTHPLHDLDTLVSRYLDLKTEAEEIASQMEHVKEQLRTLGVGQHATASGVTVTVQAPARRFNAKTAEQILPAEVLELCKADGYDPKKLKNFLSPVLLDQCMDSGTGAPVVKVG